LEEAEEGFWEDEGKSRKKSENGIEKASQSKKEGSKEGKNSRRTAPDVRTPGRT